MSLRHRTFTATLRWLAGAALATACAWPALAQPAAGPAWNELSPAQRTALAPLQGEWPRIDRDRKQKWLEVASRFGSMPPEQQARVRERMSNWAKLSPEQRGEARVNFQQSKQVSPADRQARWEAYQALPPERRAELAERAKPASVAPQGPARALRQAPLSAQAPKSNLVAPATAAPRPIGPTVVQGGAGATTTLVSRTPTPPVHQQPGQPKIVANPKLVDRATLLPKAGPQAAGARPPVKTAGLAAQGGAASATPGAAAASTP
ncbi:MAG: DUF3106 domain-containing protein [Burkholderiaceae bacterium]